MSATDPHQNGSGSPAASSRRWDRAPETARDTRFFDLRESGYTGWIDQDGYAVDRPTGTRALTQSEYATWAEQTGYAIYPDPDQDIAGDLDQDPADQDGGR